MKDDYINNIRLQIIQEYKNNGNIITTDILRFDKAQLEDSIVKLLLRYSIDCLRSDKVSHEAYNELKLNILQMGLVSMQISSNISTLNQEILKYLITVDSLLSGEYLKTLVRGIHILRSKCIYLFITSAENEETRQKFTCYRINKKIRVVKCACNTSTINNQVIKAVSTFPLWLFEPDILLSIASTAEESTSEESTSMFSNFSIDKEIITVNVKNVNSFGDIINSEKDDFTPEMMSVCIPEMLRVSGRPTGCIKSIIDFTK